MYCRAVVSPVCLFVSPVGSRFTVAGCLIYIYSWTTTVGRPNCAGGVTGLALYQTCAKSVFKSCGGGRKERFSRKLRPKSAHCTRSRCITSFLSDETLANGFAFTPCLPVALSCTCSLVLDLVRIRIPLSNTTSNSPVQRAHCWLSESKRIECESCSHMRVHTERAVTLAIHVASLCGQMHGTKAHNFCRSYGLT